MTSVLLVEDSPLISGALKIVLEAGGFDVTLAESVKGAEMAGSLKRADVCLLDLTLEDGDGLQILKSLEETGMEPKVTFAMTGHDDEDTRTRCLKAGCKDVLIKPVPIRDLIQTVRAAATQAA